MDQVFVSCCPHDCPDSCPMLVRKYENDTIRLEGNPQFSLIGGGWICKKGKRWEYRVRSPKRLTSPLMKDGSSWREISWEKAISLWALRIHDALSNEGPLSNFIYQSAGSLFYSKKLFKKCLWSWEDIRSLKVPCVVLQEVRVLKSFWFYSCV